jgi:hypothetical protein
MVTMNSTEFPRSDAGLMKYLISGSHRPNLLIHGAVGNGLLRALREACAAPLSVVRLPGPMPVPDIRTGTLFLDNPSAMTLSQQVTFHDWLDAGRGNVQIISFTREPLWPLVQEGRFLEGLYYRLNVVSLDARDPSEVRGF